MCKANELVIRINKLSNTNRVEIIVVVCGSYMDCLNIITYR